MTKPRSPSQPATHSLERIEAHLALQPQFRAAELLTLYGSQTPGQLEAMHAELLAHATQAKRGDLSRATEMLVAQAHWLDALAFDLMQKAVVARQHDPMTEPHMLAQALTAQEQSRRCWETLALVQGRKAVA